MLMAFNKVCAFSVALLVSVSLTNSLFAQCADCNSQPVAGHAADCGCRTAHRGFAGNADQIPMYEMIHGCRYKRDIGNLWDGYCDEARTYCDSDHEPKCGLFGCGSLGVGAKGCGLKGCGATGCGNMACNGGGSGGCSSCASALSAPCGKADCGCKGLPKLRHTGACNTGTCKTGNYKVGGLLHSLKGGCTKKGCADAGCADAGCADLVPAAAAKPVVTPVPLAVALGVSRAE